MNISIAELVVYCLYVIVIFTFIIGYKINTLASAAVASVSLALAVYALANEF